jgi:hypothetical protein
MLGKIASIAIPLAIRQFQGKQQRELQRKREEAQRRADLIRTLMSQDSQSNELRKILGLGS